MTKEPFVRIVKNNNISLKKKVLIRVVLLTIALILSTIFIAIVSKKNPFPAYSHIVLGTFGNTNKLFGFLKATIMLLGIAIALVPAYKMKFWNVGAQGQVLIGALLTATGMIYLNKLPNAILIPLMLIMALIGGGIWGMIPAIFKSKYHTNETLFTLMMNYVAIQLVAFLTENWRGPKSSLGILNIASKKGWLPVIGNNVGREVYIPMIVVLLLVFCIFIYMNKTKQGYEITVIGESKNTAKYIGIKYHWVIVRTMIISGALCGLIGFFYVSGYDHTISSTTSGSYGFTAIIVAWLGHFNPILMIVYACLIIFLNKGAMNLKNVGYSPNLNEYSCEFIVLIIIIAIMLSEFFIKYKLAFNFQKKKSNEILVEREGVK